MKEAVSLDEFNETTIWQDAIKLEMKNSRVAFKLCKKVEKAPFGHNKITCHLLFDLKLDMKQKSRYVAGDHLTDVTTYTNYFSVVSRDTVHIIFLMDSLNNLEILASEI